jgi:hypothetical protein
MPTAVNSLATLEYVRRHNQRLHGELDMHARIQVRTIRRLVS